MLTPNIELKNKTILVTGAAGFIGANLVSELLRTVGPVKLVGLDSCNDYYDVSLKDTALPKSISWQKQSLIAVGPLSKAILPTKH